jgi:septum formation protein
MDTIVVIDNVILEKPGTSERAMEMLKGLRGRTHSVYTAVTLVYPKNNQPEEHTVNCFVEETIVEFADVSDEGLKACKTNIDNGSSGGHANLF